MRTSELECLESFKSKNADRPSYLNKMQGNKIVEDDFGTQEFQITYYLWRKNPIAVGKTGTVELDDHWLVVTDFTIPEGSDDAGKVVQLKKLLPKAVFLTDPNLAEDDK